MATTNFTDGTVITSEWCNETDALVHDVFGAATTDAAARTALGVAIGTDVQAYSANLAEYAAVNPTAAGLALLDDATASDQRTTLGAQESSAILASFAALASGGNQLAMFSSANTFSLRDFKDQDDMSSNSDTAIPSQQSVKAYVDSRTPLTSSFTSSEQVITSGGSLSIPHGLGQKPKIITAYLVCKTAENGYSIGDELVVVVGSDDSYSFGYEYSMIRSATNLEIRFGSNPTNLFFMPNKTTGTRTNLTNANWTIVFQAFA
jgi:hypothetical protein